MVSHYTAIVMIIAFVMVSMIVSVSGNHFMPSKNRHYFILLFALLIVANLAEWMGVLMNGGVAELRAYHITCKFIEFIVTPAIPAISILALGGSIYVKVLKIPVISNVVLQVVSLFSGIVFSVDASNIYHRGTFYVFYIIFFASGMLFLLLHCIRTSLQYQNQNKLFLCLIMLLVVFAAVSQIAFSYLRMDWVCVSIAAIMFYIYYDQLVQQMDFLTTLLNRRSYECHIENIKKASDIYFFDVDRFKDVNDTYGHSFGDECLYRHALTVKQVFGKEGYCFRYGGDEFCAILIHKADKDQVLLSCYLNEVEKLRQQDERFPYVSVGYTTYHPNEETIQTAIERADAMMYQYKELHHRRTDCR